MKPLPVTGIMRDIPNVHNVHASPMFLTCEFTMSLPAYPWYNKPVMTPNENHASAPRFAVPR